MNKRPCPACQDQGWRFLNTGNDPAPTYQIQRCGACERYESDPAAVEGVVKLTQSQWGLALFVEQVAGLKLEGELDDDGPFEPTSENAIPCLNQLILEARQLLGTADSCDECGETVPYVVGCPNGTELCRDCFEAAQP